MLRVLTVLLPLLIFHEYVSGDTIKIALNGQHAFIYEEFAALFVAIKNEQPA